MTEPGEPKPEYKLSDEDFELIHQIDFRLNNIMTDLISGIDKAVREEQPLPWSDDTLRALQRFFWGRCEAMDNHKPAFDHCANSDLQKIAVLFEPIKLQLMSITGAIASYIKNRDAKWFLESVVENYRRIKPYVIKFARNPAYIAYGSRILSEDLEATRVHFSYEDSRSGE